MIPRPRLFALLDRHARLSFVVAPAGYGKTTLICNWLASRPQPVAWLTLDNELDDPFLFLAHLVAAIRKLFPEFAQELWEHLRLYTHLPTNVAAEMLCAELDALECELTLVLDDYHTIRNSEVHAIVAEVLRRLPPHMHLVLATRRDPPLPLARLRAQGAVVEIRSNELNFTESETRQLMESALGTPLDERELDHLVRGTEGWVASLQLARLYFRQEQGLASLVQALEMGARHAMDFLAEEVFGQLPDAMQEFLIQTAILERLCAHSCAAVTGGDLTAGEARASLRWLAANGVFTTALDDTQECFRYHPIFRQQALQQLRRRYSAEQIGTLHRRAGKWCADEGNTADAIRHMLAAGDKRGALQLFAQARPAVMNAEGWPELGQLLGLFPQRMVAEHLELLVAQAWVAHSQFDKAAVQACVRMALNRLARQEERPTTGDRALDGALAGLEGELEILQTYLCYWSGDVEGGLAHGERGLAMAPKELWAVHILALLFLGGSYMARGRLSRWDELFDGAVEMVDAAGTVAQLRLLSARAFPPYISGDLSGVSTLVNKSLALERRAQPHERTTLIYYFKASVHYHRNELDAVEPSLAALVARPYQSIPQMHVHAMCVLALTFQAQARVNDANQVAASTLTYAETIGREELLWIARGLVGELAARQLRLDDAAYHLRGWSSMPLAPLPFFFSSHLALARLYIMQRSDESLRLADELLDRLEQFWRDSNYTTLLIQTLALRTHHALNCGDRTAARAALERAIRLAEPGGFVRVFADLGPALEPLLDELQQQGVAPLLVAAIRGALAPLPPTTPPTSPRVSGDLSVLLTFREQEVLRLIGEQRSNQEIAAALCVSVDTVKRHNHSIFRKLQVHNRRAAALYARQFFA